MKELAAAVGGVKFGYDEYGNPGWKDGADTVTLFLMPAEVISLRRS